MEVDLKRLAKKEDALLELLATHHSVYVHVDTRRRGVVVPPHLAGHPQIGFQLGLNLPVPIRDLIVDELGWSATLSFSRVLHRVYVPWSAIYLIVGDSGIGNHWPKDTPHEAQVQRTADAAHAVKSHLHVEAQDGATRPALKAAPTRKLLPKGWKIIDGGASPKKAGGPHGSGGSGGSSPPAC
jgi:hypothetical protein